ncbi:hypothetical protein CGH72_23275 [Vibrio parahaemolyticus]|uniref:hypothetical protein n=1 Tax=Vibrio parahaemolyticus TaxID=670 RepID=UPI00111CC1C1|nr:hypothetical protein [Vibrio parahaemolyticus]TOM64122.1 hypothetical protein CGH75_01735 [Vibrio parahaemolyticus]TOM64411.1 hypothetical protein CGH73_22485 [Vibrio parahaemolyticus]TOM65976.1 hypothetical protein CGH72_23275 [Vibrio parahaemolyticus]TOO89948.1 hypothetical protein CGH29_03855 [Vibrio parahaemolyticus]
MVKPKKKSTHKKSKAKKRNKKKQRTAKVGVTPSQKAQGVIEKTPILSYISPPKFYVGCESGVIGEAEYQFMYSQTYVEGIDVAIYPATENFNHYITQRMLVEEQDIALPDSVNWIVVKLKNMLYLDSFIELDDAKQYVRANFPNVKVIRLNSLGTKDLRDGEEPVFAPMPDFKSATQEEWIQFALQREDEFGDAFDTDEVIGQLLQELVDKHQASPSIVEEHYNEFDVYDYRGNAASGLDYAAKHGLSGVVMGIRTLQEFTEEYSRLWRW